jgi:acetate kinase
VCRDLGFLGVRLDPSANAASAAVISASDSRVAVRIIPTDEEQMIARIALRMMNDPTRTGSPS